MESTTLTIRVPIEVRDKLARIADGTRRSKSWLAAEAVAAYVERELAIIEGIQQGLADMAAGQTVPHEQAMAELRAVVDEARQAKVTPQ
ncbi:CopG family ribbon-helix-helix protein [Novosphingobium sp.]|uniref:CopG family ribbon-helix-helix protein n=1 Tax=Novosphingobium sp. TaxID=1874826 RepID=UPI003BA917C8